MIQAAGLKMFEGINFLFQFFPDLASVEKKG